MTARADILAGRAVIVVSIQDQIDKQLRIIRGKMRAFSNAMSEIGGDLFRGGIAGTVGSIFPVKAFVEFDDQVRFLRTKVVGSQQEFEKLNKEIRRLGMTTSFSPLEVAQGATLLGQAGFSIPEIMRALQPVLDLGRGGMVDLSTSANILANSLRAFGIEARRAREVASMFIATTRLGTLDIVDLGESLKYSQGTFANLEAPIENVLGLLATLSNSGLKASLAGTSLNSAFQDMAANAEDFQKKLGVTFDEKDFEEPLIILSKISAALEGMSKPQQITIVKELSNIRSARAIFGTLLIGLDKLEANTEKIRLAAKFDEARTSALYLDDGLGGVFRRLKSGFEEMLLAFGNTTEGPLTGLGEALKNLTDTLSVLAEKYPKMIQWLVALPVLAVGAGAALLLLSTTLSKLIILLGPVLSLNWAVWTGLGIVLSGNIKFAKELGGHLKEIGVIWSKVFTLMNPKALFTWLSPMSGFFGGLRKELVQTFAVSQKLSSTGLILRPSSGGASLALQYNNVHDAVKKTTKEVLKLGVARKAIEYKGPVGGSSGGRQMDLFMTGGTPTPKGQSGSWIAPERTIRPIGRRIARDIEKALGNIFKHANITPAIIDRELRKIKLPSNLMAQVKARINSEIYASSRAAFKQSTTVQGFFDFKDLERGLITVQPNRVISTKVEQKWTYYVRGAAKRITQAFKETVERGWDMGDIRGPRTVGASSPVSPRVTRPAAGAGIYRNIVKEAPKALSLITRIRSLLSGTISLFSGAGSSLFSGVIKSGTAFVNLTYTLFMNIGRVAKMTFSLLNVFRRIFFTASGWLMIIEFLVLFGDKIPVIKDMLAALGNAFSQAFGVLHQMFGELAKDLGLVGEGIRALFSGDAESGIQKMKDGFADLGETLRNHLHWAWQAFMKEIEPGVQRIQVFFQGIMEVFRLLGATVGANFSAWDQHMSGDGESSLIDTLKAITDPELMKTSFLMIGSILKDILQAVLTIVSVIPKGSEAWNATQANLARGINTAIEYSPIGYIGRKITGQDSFKPYSDERIAEWDDAAKAAQTRSRSIDQMLSGDLDKAWNEFEERIRNIGVSTFDNTRPSQEQLDSDRFWKNLVRTGRDYANDYLGQAGGYVAQFDLALTDALRKGINYMQDSVEASDTQQQQLEQMRVQTRATVGSFEAARHNRLQTFKTEQLQEKTNDLLQQQNGILGNLDSKANPFVFGS